MSHFVCFRGLNASKLFYHGRMFDYPSKLWKCGIWRCSEKEKKNWKLTSIASSAISADILASFLRCQKCAHLNLNFWWISVKLSRNHNQIENIYRAYNLITTITILLNYSFCIITGKPPFRRTFNLFGLVVGT